MFEIERWSAAGMVIADAFANEDTYKVSLMPNGNDAVKIKRNEGMWTVPLSTKVEIEMPQVENDPWANR